MYGSRAVENYRKGSDIDLAFWKDSGKNATGAMLTGLDELPTPYLFDAIDYNQLKYKELKDRTDREVILLYESR